MQSKIRLHVSTRGGASDTGDRARSTRRSASTVRVTRATAIEHFALEVRHLARSVKWARRRVLHRRPEGIVGDAAKRQPRSLGTTVRLSRVLRGYLQAGLEDVALCDERDISHSSVERVVLPDALQLTYICCARPPVSQRPLLHRGDAPSRQLTTGPRLVFSQSVLLALVDSGMSRDDAYRVVQAAARRRIDERRNFREVVESDDDVT